MHQNCGKSDDLCLCLSSVHSAQTGGPSFPRSMRKEWAPSSYPHRTGSCSLLPVSCFCNNQPMLVLASASPRRRELLAQAGFTFEVHPAYIPEDPSPTNTPSPTSPASPAKKPKPSLLNSHPKPPPHCKWSAPTPPLHIDGIIKALSPKGCSGDAGTWRITCRGTSVMWLPMTAH